jgi:hypothetical protein
MEIDIKEALLIVLKEYIEIAQHRDFRDEGSIKGLIDFLDGKYDEN